jgi:hypothetical protein
MSHPVEPLRSFVSESFQVAFPAQLFPTKKTPTTPFPMWSYQVMQPPPFDVVGQVGGPRCPSDTCHGTPQDRNENAPDFLITVSAIVLSSMLILHPLCRSLTVFPAAFVFV